MPLISSGSTSVAAGCGRGAVFFLGAVAKAFLVLAFFTSALSPGASRAATVEALASASSLLSSASTSVATSFSSRVFFSWTVWRTSSTLFWARGLLRCAALRAEAVFLGMIANPLLNAIYILELLYTKKSGESRDLTILSLYANFTMAKR